MFQIRIFPGFAGPKNANNFEQRRVEVWKSSLVFDTRKNWDELSSIDVWMVKAKTQPSPFPFSFLLYPFSKIWIISQIYSNIYILEKLLTCFRQTSSQIELLTACNVPSVSHHQLKVVITYSLVMVSKVNLRSMAKPRAASQTSKRQLLLLKLLSMEALTHS